MRERESLCVCVCVWVGVYVGVYRERFGEKRLEEEAHSGPVIHLIRAVYMLEHKMR
jgi:hypothetical protein